MVGWGFIPHHAVHGHVADRGRPVGAVVASESEDLAYAQINKELTPAFKNNPPAPERPKNDPPKRPDNKLVNVLIIGITIFLLKVMAIVLTSIDAY